MHCEYVLYGMVWYGGQLQRVIGADSQHLGKLDQHLRSPITHLVDQQPGNGGVIQHRGGIVKAAAVTAEEAAGTMRKGDSATEGRSLRPKQCRTPAKGRPHQQGGWKTMWRQNGII